MLAGHLSIDDWRVYGFFEGGTVTINEALPGQTSVFNLMSYGFGSRLKMLKYLNGSIDVGVPLITQAPVLADSVLVTFRLFGEF
jgi:hemolysin activation/secretion protein